MAKIEVWYRAPVCATIDTDTEMVDSVEVLDESAEYWYTDSGNPVLDLKANRIADTAVWPQWEFGG